MPDSSIAAAAAAALAAERAEAQDAQEAALVTAARERLSGEAWKPLEPGALTLVHVDAESGLVVLSDGVLCLSVTESPAGGQVSVVEDRDGWTELAEVASLADVGVWLEGHPLEPEVEAWAPQTVYAVGDQASDEGVAYECIQAHTSQVGWEPPNVPALWVRA